MDSTAWCTDSVGEAGSGPITKDAEHLRLLSTFHYVVGGLAAFLGCFPFLHVGFGIAMLTGAFEEGGRDAPPPPFMGWMMVILGAALIILSWALALVIVIVGRKLAQRRAYTYCLVVAGIECVFVPFGTVLGALTLVVLMRDSVRARFGMAPSVERDPDAESFPRE